VIALLLTGGCTPACPRNCAVTVISSTAVGVFVLGMTGIATIAPFVPELIKRVLPAGKTSRVPMPLLVTLALLQASLLVMLCTWVGVRFGMPLGLRARLIDPSYRDERFWIAGRNLAAAGLSVGLAGGSQRSGRHSHWSYI
jgi:hypothetical protein